MASTNSKKKDITYWASTAIGLFLMFFFGKAFRPWAEITDMGMNILGIFLGMIIMFLGTGSMAWPSIIALFQVVMVGYKTTSEAFSAFLGTSTTVQMLAYLAICEGLRASGAGAVIAKFIITRKFVKGRPVLFTFFFFLAFFIAGIFVPPTGGIIFAFSVWENIRDVLGYDKNDKYSKAVLVGLYISCMLGVYTLPFKTMSSAVIKSFTASLGVESFAFNNGMYIVTTFFIGIALLLLYSIAIKVLFKCDLTPIKQLDIATMEGFDKESIKLNKKQCILLIFFALGVLYPLVMMFVPQTLVWYEKANSIGAALWMLLMVALLGIVRIDGKNIFSVEKNLHDGTVWGVITAVGVLAIVGNGLSDPNLGIRAWLTSLIGPLFSSISWPMFIFLCMFISVLVTNFFSNMVTGIIVATIAAPFCVGFMDAGIDVSAVAIAIAFSIQMSYLTVAAYTAAPLLLGREDMSNKYIWTKGLVPIAIFLIVGTLTLSLAGLIF